MHAFVGPNLLLVIVALDAVEDFLPSLDNSLSGTSIVLPWFTYMHGKRSYATPKWSLAAAWFAAESLPRHPAGSHGNQYSSGQGNQYGSGQDSQYAGYPNVSPAPDSYHGGQRQQQGAGTHFPPAPAYAGIVLHELPDSVQAVNVW